MRVRWFVVLAAIAAVHFAATGAAQRHAASHCRAPSADCRVILPTASLLSMPLLPIATKVFPRMGWRRAFVIFAVNSGLVATVLTGSVWWVMRGRARRDG